MEHIQQPNQQILFDIWILTDMEREFCCLIKLQAKGLGYNWLCHCHIPYLERVGRGILQNARRFWQQEAVPLPPTNQQSEPLWLGTYKINAVAKKKLIFRLSWRQRR